MTEYRTEAARRIFEATEDEALAREHDLLRQNFGDQQVNAARAAVAARYPELQQREADIAQHISADPGRLDRYQRMYAADAQGAMEWAVESFRGVQRAAGPAGPLEGRNFYDPGMDLL